jgi:hypothetical protein
MALLSGRCWFYQVWSLVKLLLEKRWRNLKMLLEEEVKKGVLMQMFFTY